MAFFSLKKKKNIISILTPLVLTFNCLESKALVTHTLNYDTLAGSSGELSGSIEIDETQVEYGTALSDGAGGLPTWVSSLTLNWDNGNGGAPEATFDEDDFILLRWVLKSGVTPDYNADLVPQFDNISFVRKFLKD